MIFNLLQWDICYRSLLICHASIARNRIWTSCSFISAYSILSFFDSRQIAGSYFHFLARVNGGSLSALKHNVQWWLPRLLMLLDASALYPACPSLDGRNGFPVRLYWVAPATVIPLLLACDMIRGVCNFLATLGAHFEWVCVVIIEGTFLFFLLCLVQGAETRDYLAGHCVLVGHLSDHIGVGCARDDRGQRLMVGDWEWFRLIVCMCLNRLISSINLFVFRTSRV